MKRIAITIPRGNVLPSAIVGSYLLLTQVNEFLAQQGHSPIFEIVMVGYKKMHSIDNWPLVIKTDLHFQDSGPFDLIIIPGFIGDMQKPLELNTTLINWMKTQHLSHNTELASMCTGAFLIAATGLIDGKSCTTHWAFAENFRKTFPTVKLLPEYIVTDEAGIYSSAGAYSSLNLILYLVEKYCRKEVAVWLSKAFQIDLERNSQLPFIIFNRQKTHQDAAIHGVQEFIEGHFSERIQVKGLADRFNFSRRSLIRRFKEATGNTPIEYIQRVRIEAAKRLLESTADSIESIIGEAGYQDAKTFRETFKRYTGYSPSAYRNKYHPVDKPGKE